MNEMCSEIDHFKYFQYINNRFSAPTKIWVGLLAWQTAEAAGLLGCFIRSTVKLQKVLINKIELVKFVLIQD